MTRSTGNPAAAAEAPEVPQRKARKKRRRVRSPHPGVVLIPPDLAGRHLTWRARFKDPDTGRLTKVRLDPTALPTAEARREWAVRKSHAVLGRAMEIKSGAPKIRSTPFADAIDEFFKSPKKPLRDGTKANYQAVADKLVAWASKVGITKTDQLTRPRLLDFRTVVIAEKKKLHLEGSKRRELIETDEPRSPHTINGDLRKLKTILGRLIDRGDGLLPRLTREDLTVALEEIDAELERVDYLKPAELRRLLEAALRHDAATYVFTREEEAEQRRLARLKGHTRLAQAELRPGGETERYEHKIAPFLATLVLSGMRLGEALPLLWKQDTRKPPLHGHVDLDELDDDGHQVGAIHLPGAGNKTKKARTIGLEVSPALKALLAAMHLRSGGKGQVFAGLTQGVVDAAIKRLQQDYGAPRFSAQKLRRTCGTYLTNAAGIFGAASAYRSAKQLGHSVVVAENHYTKVARGIPREARDLETAMQISDLMTQIVARVSGGEAQPKLSVVS